MTGVSNSDCPELVPIMQEAFLRDGEIVGLKRTSPEKGKHFMSTASPLEVRLKRKNGAVDIKRVFVKQPCLGGHDRLDGLSLAAFNNEVFMYDRVLPALGIDSLVGKMISGKASTCRKRVFESYVAIEDLTVQGFTLGKYGIFMDLPHLTIAIRALGQFHARSYLKKITEGLADLTSHFQEVHMPDFDKYSLIAQAAIQRATEHRVSDELAKKLNKLMSDPAKYVGMTKIERGAEEPFAVICHGDFNANNIFFKYGDDGQPIEVKFFDFQYSCYGDPTIDLAFVLYLNTRQELRDNHWDLLLDTYWKELESVPGLPFTKDQFFNNFARKIICPVIFTSHFLPVLLSRQPIDFNKVLNLPEDEIKDFYRNIGGNEGSLRTRQIVDDIFQRGYLAESIKFVEGKLNREK